MDLTRSSEYRSHSEDPTAGPLMAHSSGSLHTDMNPSPRFQQKEQEKHGGARKVPPAAGETRNRSGGRVDRSVRALTGVTGSYGLSGRGTPSASLLRNARCSARIRANQERAGLSPELLPGYPVERTRTDSPASRVELLPAPDRPDPSGRFLAGAEHDAVVEARDAGMGRSARVDTSAPALRTAAVPGGNRGAMNRCCRWNQGYPGAG